jgi:cytochrome c peroxidase
MKARWFLAAAVFAPVAGFAACPGYSVCPALNYARIVAASPRVAAIQASIASGEASAVQQMNANGIDFARLMSLLGQALAFDPSLSANGRQSCAECHFPGTAFAGGLAALARAGGIFPGAQAHRTGFRNIQSLAYAGFAPVLAYNATTGAFSGGNFWDSRATGLVTGTPAADQAATPLTNPFEMALPDAACAVRRVAQAPYGAMFGKVWGSASLNIAWPAVTDTVCARLNNNAADQHPLPLSPAARARAMLTVQQIGLTIAAWETSSLVSPFAAKFDAVQSGTADFTPAEQRGYTLFTGRAHCAACHTATGARPLFTDFSSANIGVPHNAAVPYLTENAPAADGYVANPAGPAFIDAGLGAFLASPADTNAQWQAQAPRFMGAFQVPTLRNTAGAGRVSYMHNGYFTTLKTVVHFLNTRDALPRCGLGRTAGVSCWPAAEIAENIDTTLTGKLGLSDTQENDIVAFLNTLSDFK